MESSCSRFPIGYKLSPSVLMSPYSPEPFTNLQLPPACPKRLGGMGSGKDRQEAEVMMFLEEWGKEVLIRCKTKA